MENLPYILILILIPMVFYSLIYLAKKNDKYLRKFNDIYHMDNMTDNNARKLLKLESFPYHATKEIDTNKGMEMDMQFLRDQDAILDNLTIVEHKSLIKGFDNYLMGDISSIREAKKITKERGYKI